MGVAARAGVQVVEGDRYAEGHGQPRLAPHWLTGMTGARVRNASRARPVGPRSARSSGSRLIRPSG
ncbi:hypothetical protein BH18ACT7_BH18ACT7_25620 [soil metagenome]